VSWTFLFYILLIWRGVRTHPTYRPAQLTVVHSKYWGSWLWLPVSPPSIAAADEVAQFEVACYLLHVWCWCCLLRHFGWTVGCCIDDKQHTLVSSIHDDAHRPSARRIGCEAYSYAPQATNCCCVGTCVKKHCAFNRRQIIDQMFWLERGLKFLKFANDAKYLRQKGRRKCQTILSENLTKPTERTGLRVGLAVVDRYCSRTHETLTSFCRLA